jgi:hypothetical protein
MRVAGSEPVFVQGANEDDLGETSYDRNKSFGNMRVDTPKSA